MAFRESPVCIHRKRYHLRETRLTTSDLMAITLISKLNILIQNLPQHWFGKEANSPLSKPVKQRCQMLKGTIKRIKSLCIRVGIIMGLYLLVPKVYWLLLQTWQCPSGAIKHIITHAITGYRKYTFLYIIFSCKHPEKMWNNKKEQFLKADMRGKKPLFYRRWEPYKGLLYSTIIANFNKDMMKIGDEWEQ